MARREFLHVFRLPAFQPVKSIKALAKSLMQQTLPQGDMNFLVSFATRIAPSLEDEGG